MAYYTAYSVTPSGYVVNFSSLVDVNDDYIIFTTDDYNQYIFYGEIDFTDTNATGSGTLVHVYRTGVSSGWYWHTDITENTTVSVDYSDYNRNYVFSNSGYTNTVPNTSLIRTNSLINYSIVCIFAFVSITSVISEVLRISRRAKNNEILL